MPSSAAQSTVSAALTRLIRDMRGGRVSPHVVQASSGALAAALDAPALLRDAVRNGRLPQAIKALRPQIPLYANLMRALAR